MIPADHTTSPQKRRWRTLFGYLFALACLVWVFHDLHPRAILHSISGMSWRWIPLAVFFDILSYYSQGLRWSYLLHPLGRISALESTRAIYAGLFTNEILPLRAGELVRLWLVARRLEVRFVTVIPSVVVERFFDGI